MLLCEDNFYIWFFQITLQNPIQNSKWRCSCSFFLWMIFVCEECRYNYFLSSKLEDSSCSSFKITLTGFLLFSTCFWHRFLVCALALALLLTRCSQSNNLFYVWIRQQFDSLIRHRANENFFISRSAYISIWKTVYRVRVIITQARHNIFFWKKKPQAEPDNFF